MLKKYLVFLIFGTACFLLIFFGVLRIFTQIKETSQTFSDERNKVVYLNAEKENIQKIEKNYKTYETDVNKIDNLFFSQNMPIDFINFLEKTATDTQVKMDISALTNHEQGQDLWPSLSLQVVVLGSFSNTSKFIEKIEHGSYLIEITKINVTSLSQKEVLSKETEGIPSAETRTILLLKAYTR
jgi:hypothetical protein